MCTAWPRQSRIQRQHGPGYLSPPSSPPRRTAASCPQPAELLRCCNASEWWHNRRLDLEAVGAGRVVERRNLSQQLHSPIGTVTHHHTSTTSSSFPLSPVLLHSLTKATRYPPVLGSSVQLDASVQSCISQHAGHNLQLCLPWLRQHFGCI